jgi:predicted ATPase/DNA-binding SARP family transcriptional activator
MRINLMGPLAVLDDDGQPLKVGGPKQRAVLAMLALYDGRVVPADALVDGIWGEDPPATVRTTIQVYVHGLRKALGDPALIQTHAPGYLLTDIEVDLAEAARLRDEASSRSPAGAEPLLARVVELWQGGPLADLQTFAFAGPVTVQLNEQRMTDLEALNECRLALGRHRDLLATLESLVARHPTHEGFWVQLVLALYRSGRQGDALMTYRRAREALAAELGVDPGPALRELEAAVLQQDPKLDLAPVATAVPSTAADKRPGATLPAAPNALVGRDADLEELVRQLSDRGVRVVTLTGPGGAGKTRLSVAVARAVLAAYDDVVFVDLGAATGRDGFLSGIGGGLGVPPDEADEPGLVAALAGRRLLVVLDNLEQVDQAAEVVARLVREAPDVTFLVTSRTPLRIGAELVHPVTPLAGRDAVALFVARAKGVRPGLVVDAETEAVVAELCRWLDRLPLALEIAAAGTRLLTPAAVLERVRAGTHRLAGGPVDLPERQRTLASTVAWSLELLAPAARDLLARLVVFEAGFGLDAVEAVCGADLDVVDALSDLVDSSLLRPTDRPGELSFTLYRTVREHPDLTLRGAVADELRERHARWHLTLVGSLATQVDGPGHEASLRRFSDAEPDLAAAVRHFVATDDGRAALDLAAGLAPYWIATGRNSEGLQLLATLRPVTDDDAVLAEEAAVLRGVLQYHLTEWADAIATLSAARRDLLTAELGARADCHLAAALMVTGSLDEGIRLAEGALAAAESLGVYDVRVTSIAALAIAAAIQGDLAAERQHYRQRLRLVREHGDRARTVDTLSTLAEIDLEEGDFASAQRHAEEALALLGEDMPAERRDTLLVLARVLLEAGDGTGAGGLLAEAVEISATLGQALGLAQALLVTSGWAAETVPSDAARLLGAAGRLLAPTVLAEMGEDPAHGMADRLREVLGPQRYDEEHDAGAHLARGDVLTLCRRLLSGSSSAS